MPGGQTTTVEYDALGRKTAEIDAANIRTEFDYDAVGNLVKVADAEGGITRYEYDESNNRTAIVDARGNTTTFAFDSLNRMTGKTMPNNGTETYEYDAAGRRTAKTDAKGQLIAYDYDANSRLLSRNYPDNTTVSFSYTATGKRNTATDRRGTTGYAYDTRDRLAKHTYPDGQAISYTYDETGRLHTIHSALTGTTTYDYSGCCGRLQSVTDPQGNVTTYTYDPAGNRTGLSYPNGTSVSYTYDTNNRLTNLTHTSTLSGVIASYAYTLGPIGNRTRIDEANGISRQYTYDNLYRLTNETVTDPTNAQTYTNDYTYDAVGNRQNKTNTPYNQTAVSNDYTYNNADQLLTENGVTYIYDLNGNLATRTDSTGTTTYEYNYDDRLVQVQAPSGATVNYEYDADNNRVTAATGAGTTKYLVDTNRSLAQVLAEYSTTGVIIASYVYADDLVSMTKGGAASYYHFDGLGSTRLLTDAAGAITDTYDYDAFGNEIGRTGMTENEFQFTGQQYDANVGFYYLRARYYQPDTGRFTALDPFSGDPYAPMSLHKYLYAANDPVNKIDPSGMEFSLGSLSTSMSMQNTIRSITSGFNTAFRIYQTVDTMADILSLINLIVPFLAAFSNPTSAGVTQALEAELQRVIGSSIGGVADAVNAAFHHCSANWKEISEAILDHAPVIAARSAQEVVKNMPGFLKAQAQGKLRYVFMMPSGPTGYGNPQIANVGSKYGIGFSLGGGRLFGFGIKNISMVVPIFRIDYWYKTHVAVHYHVGGEETHNPIWGKF